MTEFLNVLDKFISWGIIIFGVVFFLVKVIIKLKNKADESAHDTLLRTIKDETKDRKESIEAVMEAVKVLETNYKRSNEQLLQTFKEGIKEERQFRTDVMVRQQEYIEKIFERIEALSNEFGQISIHLNESIKAQEKICEIRHKNYET
jgi:archaellum component FlaC